MVMTGEVGRPVQAAGWDEIEQKMDKISGTGYKIEQLLLFFKKDIFVLYGAMPGKGDSV